MNFLTNINLNGNKLEGAIIENAIIQNVGVDPSISSLKEGQIWYNSTTHQLKYAGLVEGVITPIVIGEGEVTKEELANLVQKVTALENTVNGTEEITGLVEEITGLVEEVTTLKETVNGTEDQPSLNKQINDALTEAENAKTAADSAQAAANAAQAAANAAQDSANSKVEKVNGPVDNIVLFGADGTIKDGGKTIQQVIDEAVAAGAGEGEEIDLTGYVQKVESTEGNIVLFGANKTIADNGYSIQDTISTTADPSDHKIPTANAIVNYVSNKISNIAQGITFKGIINSTDSIIVPYNLGDMYYVGEAGTYFDYNCEVGDVFIAKVAKQEGEAVAKEDWSILESNKDIFKGEGAGLVPPAPTDGITGYLDNTGNWSAPVAKRWSGSNDDDLLPTAGKAVWTIEHNLGRKDVQVIVYEIKNEDEYNQVMCDVTLIGDNYCNIGFNVSNEITKNTYYAVVM